MEHFHGVTLSKSSQKADWARRPLSPTMVTYALNDVNYMLDMADKLMTALREKGRVGWFEEICRHSMERARERYLTGHPDPWRIQGSGKLNRKGLAALRELWAWRDSEAKSWDRPSFMVCSNADLIQWSVALQEQRPVSPSPASTPTGATGSRTPCRNSTCWMKTIIRAVPTSSAASIPSSLKPTWPASAR